MRSLLLLLLPVCLTYFAQAQQKQDTSALGMVASAHPMATEAGRQMLRLGGNAFDAIAASSFMLAVVEPSMSGIGGRLQAIWQLPDGTIRGIDATTQVPASYVKRPKEDENGYGTIGVPGMVKGIVGMHGLHGRLPLRTVMRPAIEAASKGHPMHADESRRQSLELKELRKYPATARHFLPKDTVPAAGASFRQPALASTLKMIAKDRGRSFYGGSIGYALAKEVGEGGGFLTIADMEAYRAPDARVLRGAYRGYEIVGMGLPCYGAIVIEMLQRGRLPPPPRIRALQGL